MQITISDLSSRDLDRAFDAANAELAARGLPKRLILSSDDPGYFRSADANGAGYRVAQIIENGLSNARPEVRISTSHDIVVAAALLRAFATIA